MGPDASWIEVRPGEDEFNTLVLYPKAAMEKQNSSKVAHPSVLFSTTDIEPAHEKMKQYGVKVDDIM